jgi:hypothetical protein
LILAPNSPSSGGTARTATRTLIAVTTPTAVASESSSEPGCRKAEPTTATIRVTPAKRAVRPALPRAAAAACQGPLPPSSSSRKRGDDQQRVVDPERQAHHRADDERERVDGHRRAQQGEHPAPGEDREGAEQQRHRGGHDRAEDEQEDEDEQRRHQQLRPLGRVQRFLLQGERDGGVARLRGPHRPADPRLQRSFQRRHGLLHRDRKPYVEVDQDKGLAAAGTQGRDRAAIPRRDHGRGGVPAQRPYKPDPLAVELGGRAAEEDDEGGGIAEVARRQRFGLGRPGSRNLE